MNEKNRLLSPKNWWLTRGEVYRGMGEIDKRD